MVPTRTTCNTPKIRDQLALSRLLRKKWLPVPDLYIEVCGGCIDIQGPVWPAVYRIPDDMDSVTVWPGMPELGAPVDLMGLLADVSPYLEETLSVNARSSERSAFWVTTPQRNITHHERSESA